MQRRYAIVAVAMLSLILLAGASFLREIANPGTNATTSSQSRQTVFSKGLTFTPAKFDQQGFSDYFARAKQAGSIVTWAGDWETLSDGQSAPYVLETLAHQNNLTLVPELQFFNSSSGQLLRPLNSTPEAKYENLALAFAKNYDPPLMALGVEVNVLYEHSPSDYQRFVTFFDATRSAIRAASPGTYVFVIFQLEKMKGRDGGLFGGVNDASKSEWGRWGTSARAT